MIDKKLWKYVLLTAVLEIAIVIIVTVVLIAYYPAITIWIILGAIVVTAIYLGIHYYIYRPVFGHRAAEPQDELIGHLGKTITDLTPRGQVKIRNEVWSARSNAGFLAVGTNIKVVKMEGIQLIVQPLERVE
jgi:membrane protein implicated in regulation of membrane protease activity